MVVWKWESVVRDLKTATCQLLSLFETGKWSSSHLKGRSQIKNDHEYTGNAIFRAPLLLDKVQ